MSSHPSSSKLLLSTPTKGSFQGLRLICLLLALAFMALQLGYTFKAFQQENYEEVEYYPAIVAAGLFLLFLLFGRSGGEINVYRDRIQGKRSMGVSFEIPTNTITNVEFAGKRLAIKGADNQLLLVESPLNPKIGGLIWLCKQYGVWPDKLWNVLDLDAKDDFPRATRYFLGEDDLPTFGDNGFIVSEYSRQWYLPETTMFPIIGRVGESTRIFAKPQPNGATLFYLDPSPDSIPMAAFCQAIMTSTMASHTKADLIAILAEYHAGNLLIRSKEGITGECAGYEVRIVMA